MFCVKCGQNLPDNASFCPKCGETVHPESAKAHAQTLGVSSPERSGHLQDIDSLRARQAALAHPQTSAGLSRGALFAIVCAIVAVVAAVAVVVIVVTKPVAGQSATQNSTTVAPAQSASAQVKDKEPSEQEQARIAEENARAQAEEQAQREAEERKAQFDAELAAAYSANPSIVYAAPSKASDFVKLTGTIVVQQGLDKGSQSYEDVCMLQIPAEITVAGTQYGDQSSNLVILSNDFSRYNGQTLTLNLQLGVRATASIASAEFSMLQGIGATVERVWNEAEETAVQGSAASREQIAIDATMALLTNADVNGNDYFPVECQVAQYLAPGSAAEAEFSRGWNPDFSHKADKAEVQVANGDHYQLQAQMLSFRPDTGSGSARIHLITVYLTFDANDKITDIKMGDYL